MSKNDSTYSKRDQKNGKPDQRPPALSVKKTGKMIAPPLITKTHYAFEEAFSFIKSKFPSFTYENLLNHGFQEDVSFFVKVPPEVNVQSLFEASDSRFVRDSPRFLTLYSSACEDIERDGSIHLSYFPKGYWYDGTYKFIEALPNYNIHDDRTPLWQTFKNNELYSIPIFAKDLLVTKSNLIRLTQRIELRLAHDKKSENQKEILNKFFLRFIPQTCSALIDLASELPNCRPVDLLRRAIQNKLTLLAIVPNGVAIRSSNYSDYASGAEYILQPQLLALNPSDCTNIYDNEQASISDFPAGYIFDDFGEMTRITPSLERPWLSADSTSWRIYRGIASSTLSFSYEHLYVMQSNVTELRDQESQDFKIRKGTVELLALNGFISLERAVEIAKRKHPECTVNHLLRLGYIREFKILTPIPVAITVNKFGDYPINKDPSQNSQECPELLVLDIETCLDIEHHGKTEKDRFSLGYWTYQIDPHSNAVAGVYLSGLATYYKGNAYKIELTPDRLFVKKSNLFRVVEDNSSLWNLVGRMLLESIESQKSKKATQSHNDSETPPKINTESNMADFENIDAKEELNQSKAALINIVVLRKSNDQPQHEENVDALPELTSQRILFLSRVEVMELLHISRSSMFDRMKRDSPYYDEMFPLPVEVGRRGKKHWVEAEIKAYQRELINRRPVIDRVG